MTTRSSPSSPAHDKDTEKDDNASQIQNSRQSLGNATASGAQQGAGQGQGQTGIGSSQGQDLGTSEREKGRGERATGTPDVERGSDVSSSESLVNESTGAFKERP